MSLAAAAAQPAVGQGLPEFTAAVRSYRLAHEREILGELRELLAIPNFALDSENISRNAAFIMQLLERRGVRARLLELEGSPPAVFGELTTPGATKTVVFYAHYDGQSVDPTRWWTPAWEPTLRRGTYEQGAEVVAWDQLPSPVPPEWRIYARSASDDKSPIVTMLTALDALRATGRQPSVNLKFFFEGEEERGSAHLGEMLRRHQDLLGADLWLFCDGPVHQSREPQIVFGVRGVMGVNATLYGPLRPLHSGHYGNWAPNPGVLLAHLVTRLRDEDGRILIEDFYSDVRPISEADRAAIAAAPAIDEELRAELALAATEGGNAPLGERILLPALNLQGLAMGLVGEAAQNTIQDSAQAAIGFRLVPDQRPERVRELVERHLGQLGYHLVFEEPSVAVRAAHQKVVKLDWDLGYRALRTPLEHPASQAVLRVADATWNKPVVRAPILGGSLPLYHFDDVLHAPLIIVPIVNHDNRQHAPNENLRIANLWDGIELLANLMAGLGQEWR